MRSSQSGNGTLSSRLRLTKNPKPARELHITRKAISSGGPTRAVCGVPCTKHKLRSELPIQLVPHNMELFNFQAADLM